MARKLTKAQLKRKRQAIARRNFGLTRKKSRSTRRGQTQMAKRKRTTRRSSGNLKPMQVLIGGGIYGAARAKLSNLLAPVTNRVPLGTVADEATLFGLGYLAHKKMKDKTVKNIAMAAMAVEAARIGEAVIDGSAFSTSSSSGAGLSGIPTLG